MARSTRAALINNAEFRNSLEGSTSTLEILLKGHLWIESLLNSFLEAAAKRPAALRLDRASFSTKLNLCEAFGLLPKSFVETLRLVNRHRNDLAHNVKASMSDETVEKLIKQSSEPVRSAYARLMAAHNETDRSSTLFRLGSWLMLIVNQLGYQVLLYEYEQDYQPQHLAFATARLLEEQEGRAPAPAAEIRRLVGLPEPPQPIEIWSLDDLPHP